MPIRGTGWMDPANAAQMGYSAEELARHNLAARLSQSDPMYDDIGAIAAGHRAMQAYGGLDNQAREIGVREALGNRQADNESIGIRQRGRLGDRQLDMDQQQLGERTRQFDLQRSDAINPERIRARAAATSGDLSLMSPGIGMAAMDPGQIGMLAEGNEGLATFMKKPDLAGMLEAARDIPGYDQRGSDINRAMASAIASKYGTSNPDQLARAIPPPLDLMSPNEFASGWAGGASDLVGMFGGKGTMADHAMQGIAARMSMVPYALGRLAEGSNPLIPWTQDRHIQEAESDAQQKAILRETLRKMFEEQ